MQSSTFAKEIAGDFNPIHDTDAKRFCVPGDLLFSVFLHRYGVYQKMYFEFAGMVGEGTSLLCPDSVDDRFSLCDEQGKSYLNVDMQGESSKDGEFVSALTQRYVEFSGRTFPHILVELMQRNNVMINPDRPLVIYKNMRIELNSFEGGDIVLELDNATLNVEGKKGEANLEFVISAASNIIGRGQKSMVLSGLREYEQSRIDEIVNAYAEWKSSYTAV